MAPNAPSVVVDRHDDFALITGVVRWSLGQTMLVKGQRYDGDERLLDERPDLFGTRFEARRPEVTTRDCRNCGGSFIPPTGSGSEAQYCGRKCKQSRETQLRRAARIVSRKSWPSIPRSAAGIHEHIGELEALLGLVRLLIVHLNGRFANDEQREPQDQAELKDRLGRKLDDYADRSRLLADARKAFAELHDERTRAFEALREAASREREENNIAEANRIYRETLARREEIRGMFDEDPADERPIGIG